MMISYGQLSQSFQEDNWNAPYAQNKNGSSASGGFKLPVIFNNSSPPLTLLPPRSPDKQLEQTGKGRDKVVMNYRHACKDKIF